MITKQGLIDGQGAVNTLIRDVISNYPLNVNYRNWKKTNRNLNKAEKSRIKALLIPLLDVHPWDGVAYYAAGELYAMGVRTLDIGPMIEAYQNQLDQEDLSARLVRGKLATWISANARPKNFDLLNEFFTLDKKEYTQDQRTVFSLCWKKKSFRDSPEFNWMKGVQKYRSCLAPGIIEQKEKPDCQ